MQQETGKPPPPNVTPKMARDRAGSDHSGHMSDTTTCSCVASSIEKASTDFMHLNNSIVINDYQPKIV